MISQFEPLVHQVFIHCAVDFEILNTSQEFEIFLMRPINQISLNNKSNDERKYRKFLAIPIKQVSDQGGVTELPPSPTKVMLNAVHKNPKLELFRKREFESNKNIAKEKELKFSFNKLGRNATKFDLNNAGDSAKGENIRVNNQENRLNNSTEYVRYHNLFTLIKLVTFKFV